MSGISVTGQGYTPSQSQTAAPTADNGFATAAYNQAASGAPGTANAAAYQSAALGPEDYAGMTGGTGGTGGESPAAETSQTAPAAATAEAGATASTAQPSTLQKAVGTVMTPYVDFENWKSNTALGQFESGIEATPIMQDYEKFKQSTPGELYQAYSSYKQFDMAMELGQKYRAKMGAKAGGSEEGITEPNKASAAETGDTAAEDAGDVLKAGEKPVGTVNDLVTSLEGKYGVTSPKAGSLGTSADSTAEATADTATADGADMAKSGAADFSDVGADAENIASSLGSIAESSGGEAATTAITGVAEGAEAAGAVAGEVGAEAGAEAATGIVAGTTEAISAIADAAGPVGMVLGVIGGIVGGIIALFQKHERDEEIATCKSNVNPGLSQWGDTTL